MRRIIMQTHPKIQIFCQGSSAENDFSYTYFQVDIPASKECHG